MMKKILALTLAAVMCLTILAGCGEDKKPDFETPAAGADGALFAETVTFEMIMPNNTAQDLEDSYLDYLLLSQENVDLEISETDSFQQVYTQMLTDQDLPDLTWLNSFEYGNEFGPKGAYVNVLDYIDQMPNFKAMMEKYPEAVTKFKAKDGGLYHIPVLLEGNSTPYAFIYRKDIFEKHNLTFPTTRDEFVAVLRKLKELYPNSYPLTMRNMNGNMQGFMYLCMSFGTELALPTATHSIMNRDAKTGEYYFGPINDGMKDYVSFLNQLYEEELLHKSCITMTSGQWTESFVKGDDAKGVSFITWDKMDRIPNEIQPAGEALNPEFRVVGGAPIKMNEQGAAGTFNDSIVSSYNFLIAKSSKKVDAIIKYIDWLYSEEGILTTNWGKEGETFEYDAEGNPKWIDSVLADGDPQYSRCLGIGGFYGLREWNAYLSWQDDLHKADLEMANAHCTLTTGTRTLSYTDEQQRIFDTYALSLIDHARTNLQKFITGERDLSEWDTYVSECTAERAHFDELIKLHEDAYKECYGDK